MGVINGNETIEMESREAPPLVTETGEAPLSADDECAIEEESQFYREAGVLAPTHDQIAERAYALYVARGRTLGYALEDWLEAEKQLSEEIRKP